VVLTKLAGPAVSAGEIGPVDVVLVSHDHHADNLDAAGRELLARAAASSRPTPEPSGSERARRASIRATPSTSTRRTAAGCP
jgi:hypothetical protein